MDRTAALILAGGRGARMDLLCENRPKPVLYFAGRFRVIDFSLSNCINSNVEEITVLTSYCHSQMAGYLENWHLNNAGPCNMDILEPAYKPYKGTADAIFQNLEYLKNLEADTILVLAADHVYKMDYGKMVEFHRKAGAGVTLGVAEVPVEQASRFGILKVDGQNRVMDYEEKPEKPRNNLASMGIYVFDKETLIERIENYGNGNPSHHDMTYAIIPKILERDRFYVYEFKGYWRDIGTVESFYEANMEIIPHQDWLISDSTWPILTGERISRRPSRFEKERVVDSIISPGCIIKGHVINSVLSPGVQVDADALVKDSILMPEVSVGYHSVVDHCIIDKQVDIGRSSYIGFGESSPDCEITTILGEGAVVPSGTAIGRNCKILPDVKPEDFTSGLVVPSGSIIS